MGLCRKRRTAAPLMAVVCVALLAPGIARAAAPSFTMPPICNPASQDHHPGKVVFVQLVTPDLKDAERFYAGMFGWAFQDVAGTRQPYAIATLGGQTVAGLVQRELPAGAHMRPSWLGYFSVADVDAATKAASAHGGKVLTPPHAIPGRGEEAVVADPQGAVLGLLASSSGDPADVLNPPGQWIWRSLVTSDPATDAAFYQSLFGYQTFTLPSPPGQMHLLLASEDYARASANSFPQGFQEGHPHWLNYVRVDDAAKSVALATKLGGQVLVAPRLDRHGGMIAVVADPQGAPVGLFEWAETDTKEIAK